jgi:DNA polymerase-4
MARTVLFAEVPGFYAAIERVEDPALTSRPVIVGGDPRKRGRVQAATLDAIEAGVRLEMPMLEALQRCPGARAIRTNMRHYREVGRELIAVLRGVYPHLEKFGLGGVYADLSGVSRVVPDEVAASMREAVFDSLGLPLRVGLASGKFLARLAAEETGEAGVHRIPEAEESAFLAPLEVGRLDGVGEKTAARLAELGAQCIGDVVGLGRDRLQEVFGPHGLRIYALASGEDTEPVRAARHSQSVSREATLGDAPSDVSALSEQLAMLAQQLEEELSRQHLAASRVALKVRYTDQGTVTRSETLGTPTAEAARLHDAALRLMARTQVEARPVRGLGIQLTSLSPSAEGDRQLDLFRSS